MRSATSWFSEEDCPRFVSECQLLGWTWTRHHWAEALGKEKNHQHSLLMLANGVTLNESACRLSMPPFVCMRVVLAASKRAF